jgi:cyclopropane fatty-acyl-phospholipid synthase-like methyltransferase
MAARSAYADYFNHDPDATRYDQDVAANDLSAFDAIVSTYALHHLTPQERKTLFELMHAKTKTAVDVVIGDLMYQNDADRRRIIEKFQPTHPGMASDFEDEFFWNVDETEKVMKKLGWTTTWRRFSDLSWVGVFRKKEMRAR